MQKLFETQKKNQHSTKLENLSPEKYGRAAYAELHYTPSKLADNVLFKEATTLKKYEEDTNKLREYQALNNLFKDRISQIDQEKNGIENSLTQQIVMYRKLVQQMEAKHQSRLKEMQFNFNAEMHKIIQEKEQQAKYSQSEKEAFQETIKILEQQLESFKNKIGKTGGELENEKNQHEKLKINYTNLEDKFQKAEQRAKQDVQRLKKETQQLSRKLYILEVDSKKQLENAINQKTKEIQNLDRLHRLQLQKVQNAKHNEGLIRNQQIKDLRTTFEAEAKRVDEIVNMKDRMIDTLTNENNKEKKNTLQITCNYENEINNLTHQKSRLFEQVDALTKTNTSLNFALSDLQMRFQRQKQLQAVEHNHLADENKLLGREIQRLRDILLESSMQMQTCKQEFLRMGSQNNHLMRQLRQIGLQNQTLHRIRIDRGQSYLTRYK